MRASRVVTAIVLATTAMVVLTGCAADPDVQGVQDGLEGIPGVNGAEVSVQHPGALWNTRTASRTQAWSHTVTITDGICAELGADDTGTESLRLTADQLHTVADGG